MNAQSADYVIASAAIVIGLAWFIRLWKRRSNPEVLQRLKDSLTLPLVLWNLLFLPVIIWFYIMLLSGYLPWNWDNTLGLFALPALVVIPDIAYARLVLHVI